MKKVLLIGNFLSAFSNSKAPVEELKDVLCARGWHVVCASGFKSRVLRFLDMTAAALGLKGSFEIAVIMVYSGASFIWAETCAGLLRFRKIPYVLALHGGNLPLFMRRYPKRIQALFSSSAAIVAPSEFLMNEMNLSAVPNALIIPNGLHLDRFLYRQRREVQPKIIWLRAFHDIYQPHLVPGIVKRLAVHYPKVHATMFGRDTGDGSLQKTKKEILRLKMASHITVIEGIASYEVPRRMNEADIFLNTSAVDNMPVSIMEAMASGLCIVSSDAGGIPYLIRSGKEGLVVSGQAEVPFFEAINRLINEPSTAADVSKQARIRAEQFGWEKLGGQWEKLLLEKLRGGHAS